MATLVHWQTDRVSGELVMTGPVLVANGENKYHIIPGHADNVHLVRQFWIRQALAGHKLHYTLDITQCLQKNSSLFAKWDLSKD